MAAEQTQQLLSQAQMLQQQLQATMVQKESLALQKLEIERALKEMETARDDYVYKISGPILIKADKKATGEELNEKKTFIELKLKTLEKSESKLKEKLDEMRIRLSGKNAEN